MELTATARNLETTSEYIPRRPEYTYILFVRIIRNMAGVCSVLNKIRPSGPELGVLDLTVL